MFRFKKNGIKTTSAQSFLKDAVVRFGYLLEFLISNVTFSGYRH